MSTDFTEKTLRAFSDDLASPRPAPGGGSAAAYAGALGAALAAMVANIALKKASDPALARFVAEADALREEMLRLVDADAGAYGTVADAMKLPRATDAEKAVRSERLQAALVAASRVPLEMISTARRLLVACGHAVDLASTATVSDVGVGALLAEACARGAAMNVMANIASLRDESQVKALSEELDRALDGVEAECKKITDRVEARIAR